MENMKRSTGRSSGSVRSVLSSYVLVLLMVVSTIIVCQLRVNSLQPKLKEIEDLMRENKVTAYTLYTLLGKVGGSDHNKHGGGSNYLCVPTLNVTWDHYVDGPNSKTFLYGAEFENPGTGFFSTDNTQAIESIQDYDVPCAVCRVPTRRSVLTIPAWTSCPSGWTQQYRGYLMAGHESHKGRNKFECVDRAPDIFKGTYENKNGALFYLVEGVCGSLPCGPYIANRQITCVVCSI
uniref:Short-chain collagen C4-like n=1 Tax=Branchiostoma floridae TaxID=7739 RepID=C3YR92_BRAFL|eukprot:XP_002601077.1 hypothetical protein BRAFLDRAFT_121043 [Branchiostoma floridae]